jgi:hypothetical protein
VPAFPGADGAGGNVSGGRGGSVYHVTVLDSKLADNIPGTLYYGLTHSTGPTTVVFDVGGTIWLGLKTTEVEGWDTQNAINIPSNFTIAGQTAPGGITLAGAQVKINGTVVAGQTLPQSNVIMRNVTLAAGYGMRKANSTSGYFDNYTYDNMDINSSGVMVDHIKALYATDESISANELANNVTVQYSVIGQGQSYPQADAQNNGNFVSHALGDLWSLGSNSVSTFSHNIYVHASGRIPAIQTVATKLTNNVPAYTDFRNNVVYNWFGSAGYGSSGEPGAGGFEGNYYKVGSGGDGSSGNNTSFAIVPTAAGTTPFKNSSSTLVYQTGNTLNALNGTVTNNLPNSSFGSTTSMFTSTPFTQIPYKGVTDSAAAAYTQVTNYAGSNWQSRDLIEARLVNDVLNRTGKITALDDPNNGYNSAGQYISNSTNNPDVEWNRMLALRSTRNPGVGGVGTGVGATGATYTRAANYDTDQDGMPDIWEASMGLNPTVADNNGTKLNDGYTNLETYLNELAAWPASSALVFGNANGTSRFAEIGNWQTGVYKPSRYDTAQVNSGTVVVDVVGQHAGTLIVANASGNTATLNVTNGWIDVAQSLKVGPGGTGSVTQSGGIVRAGTSVIIGGANQPGSYFLSGGTLATPLLTRGAQGGSFSFTGGMLHTDLVAFSLTNQGGILAPGSDLNLQLMAAASMPDVNNALEAIQSFVGTTHIAGSLTLQSGSVEIDLASLTSFDTLLVDNLLTLGGTLNVVLDNGYLPNAGDRWQIGTASSISGAFDSVIPGFFTQVQGGNLFLVAVPEPSSLIILATSILPVAALRLRRRTK